MPSRTVSVGSRVGLHARPAAVIAAAVTESGAAVSIATPTVAAPVDAGSALMIMTLGARHGDEVVLSCDDEQVLEQVASLVADDLDEA